MNIRKSTVLTGAMIFAAGLGFATPASAQSRTWVSGVGDDANPCSRTAPCKTFAGAISKTSAGGEINCLDPGGFGVVTINKALTINCIYTEGSGLTGGTGFIINAPAADVFLRGLDIFGVTPATNGVRFIAGSSLHIEDCTIRRFREVNSRGVDFQPSGASQLTIINTTIANNGNGATGGGIRIQPTGTGSARVTLKNVRLQNNAGDGIRIDTTGSTGSGATLMIEDSQVLSSVNGIIAVSPGATPAVSVMVVDTLIALNGTAGISASGLGTTVRVSDSTITANNNGVTIAASAVINTYKDNRLDGNATNGAFTAPEIPLK